MCARINVVLVTTTCHGRVIDGATSSFPTSRTGQDAIVLQAPEGMQLQVAAEMMHLSPHANVRFYDGTTVGDVELGMLRGTSLDDRTFVSSKGLLRIMRVVDPDVDAGLPLVFSLRIGCVCADGAGGSCGAHGSCVNGLCKCDEGYGGGMCDTIIGDKCTVPVKINCGAHGECVDGSCECKDRYTGSECDEPPTTPCCSSSPGMCCGGGSCCKGVVGPDGRMCSSHCCTAMCENCVETSEDPSCGR